MILKFFFFGCNLNYTNYMCFFICNHLFGFFRIFHGKFFFSDTLILLKDHIYFFTKLQLLYSTFFMYGLNLRLKILTDAFIVLNSYEVGLYDNLLYNTAVDIDLVYQSVVKEINNMSVLKFKFLTYFGGWGSMLLKQCVFSLPVPVISEYDFFGFNYNGYLKKSYKLFLPAGESKRLRFYFCHFFSKQLFFSLFYHNPLVSVSKKVVWSLEEFKLLVKSLFVEFIFSYNVYFYYNKKCIY